MYASFEPLKNAALIHHYLTHMVDSMEDNLPYWLILPNRKPAEAAHCRVDDAELAGSWYEGLLSAMQMLGTKEGAHVLASFRRHLMQSWGENGLRYCKQYPWTHTIHASFHEMGYILSALNALLEHDPSDGEAAERAEGLVHGMRNLVIERKVRTFWSGDFEEPEPVFEFPNDVYLPDRGFDLSRHSGRGESCIRNAVILEPLVRYYERTQDPVALDLAKGIANHLLGVSRYFNYKMEYFGHVHSAIWFAWGLAKLGRVTEETRYTEKAKAIYDYTRSISSSFGWVPEYAQWHPLSEEHCETCCIRDMILCALELIRCGYPDYWEDVNQFSRNQLVENQVRYTGYVVCDNSRPDGNGITYHEIGQRMLGGFTGGSEPNTISLDRFRSVAGCCAGTAPTALKAVWDHVLTTENGVHIINIPCDKEDDLCSLKSLLPNEGTILLTAKEDGIFGVRIYEWMNEMKHTVNGLPVSPKKKGRILQLALKKGDQWIISFPLETRCVMETVRGMDYQVLYRGCDVIDLLPHGGHIRLYQRDLSVEPFLPKPEDVHESGASNYGPTQQKTSDQ
ncbi:MAG: hypothetical protein IKF49_06080 [Clostridia bacterium]|nr:hypothetical protein [Clostridia bacterium]